MREIVFDTETTGFDYNGEDRIIELGAVELYGLVPTGLEFRKYINPGRPVSEATIRITGITDDMLVDCPSFDDASIVDELLAFFGDSPVVAHNADFDRGFLNAELARAGRPLVPNDRWIDTLAIARQMFPGSPASLDALCRRFDISIQDRALHGALKDARLLADVYLELRGGRARSFDFAPSSNKAVTTSQAGEKQRPARKRSEPLPGRIEQADIDAHTALLETLGSEPIWKRYLS
jgi:DNA polymerase III subunit epsilon